MDCKNIQENSFHKLRGTPDMYPNPSTGTCTLLLPEERAELRITDIFGHEVKKIICSGRTADIELDASGVYLVHIQTRHGSAVRKVVISR